MERLLIKWNYLIIILLILVSCQTQKNISRETGYIDTFSSESTIIDGTWQIKQCYTSDTTLTRLIGGQNGYTDVGIILIDTNIIFQKDYLIVNFNKGKVRVSSSGNINNRHDCTLNGIFNLDVDENIVNYIYIPLAMNLQRYCSKFNRSFLMNHYELNKHNCQDSIEISCVTDLSHLFSNILYNVNTYHFENKLLILSDKAENGKVLTQIVLSYQE